MSEKFPRLREKQLIFERRISRDKRVIVLISREKNRKTALLMRIVAAEKTHRAVSVGPIDVYKNLNDNDLELCREILEHSMRGLHLQCSKCYQSGKSLMYYVSPDWGYYYRTYDPKNYKPKKEEREKDVSEYLNYQKRCGELEAENKRLSDNLLATAEGEQDA